jgi:hypothetical protein
LDEAKDHDTWNGLTSFGKEADLIAKIQELNISVPTANTREIQPAGIDLGIEWNTAHKETTYVDVQELLQAGYISDEDMNLLLGDEAVDILSLAYKTRGQLAEYRSFLQKQKVEQMTVQLQDVSGAAKIIAQLGQQGLSDQAKADLQTKLRAAHAANRDNYLADLNLNVGAETKNRNRRIDHALRQLAEMEKSGYTADILSRRSNRARRAETTDSADSSVVLSAIDFSTPAFRGECQICCGEDEIMSIVLKKLSHDESAANTADFALDFPLAAGRFPANVNILSSQCICFNCALFGMPGLSIYKEPIAAVLPTLEYANSNKQYINQQLYLALTGGLKTGVPTLAQLFATILDRTVQTKEWAGAKVGPRAEDEDEHAEIKRRRESIQWLLDSVLANIRCRETFNELGEWTTYPKALAWAAKEFASEGLTSWAINYPVTGFNQLLRFGRMTGVYSEETIQRMKSTKMIHSFVSLYLAKLLKNGGQVTKDSLWTAEVLQLVYAEFNSDLVPRDLGGKETLLTSTESFWALLAKFLAADPALMSGWVGEEEKNIMPRIQILSFWLVYFQRSHTSAKTFFANLRTSQPLAATVLDPTAPLPWSVVSEVLLSPFRNKSQFLNEQVARVHMSGTVGFKTPFGASVLGCGTPGCAHSFVPAQLRGEGVKWTLQNLDKLRQARAKHLIDAFGSSKSFSGNETGLPESTSMPAPPSSSHTSMHISIARAWSRIPIDIRRAIVTSFNADNRGPAVIEFVAEARKEICGGSRRGDIYSPHLDDDVFQVLPSFFEVLGEALAMEGRNKDDVAVYEHNFENNKIEWKAKYENAVDKMRADTQSLKKVNVACLLNDDDYELV